MMVEFLKDRRHVMKRNPNYRGEAYPCEGGPGDKGRGYLFVLNVQTGAIEAKIDTGSGDVTTPSNLAKITAITANPNTDPTITYVYGGNIKGEMFRFLYLQAMGIVGLTVALVKLLPG